VIEWPAYLNPAEYSGAVTGISLQSASGTKFTQVVIRDNVIRRWSNEVNTADVGIKILNTEQTLVDNNLINVGPVNNGVPIGNSNTVVKPWHNITTDGTLLQAYNVDTGSRMGELETSLQDVDMALFRR